MNQFARGAFVGLMLVTALWLGFHMTGCTQWQDTVHTADELAVALCKQWVSQHPDSQLQSTMCGVGGMLFSDVVALINAKPSPEAAREALVAHPPLSAAAALALPCIAPPVPLDPNPYTEPQSRIEKRLYPFIVAPPRAGE